MLIRQINLPVTLHNSLTPFHFLLIYIVQFEKTNKILFGKLLILCHYNFLILLIFCYCFLGKFMLNWRSIWGFYHFSSWWEFVQLVPKYFFFFFFFFFFFLTKRGSEQVIFFCFQKLEIFMLDIFEDLN